MFCKKGIKDLKESIDKLSEKIDLISEKQNIQFTEIMMQLKEYIKAKNEEIIGAGLEDELYNHAKEIVISSGKASTSFLQRKLGIGYSRAAHLMDTLEEEGVIGEANGATPREILIK